MPLVLMSVCVSPSLAQGGNRIAGRNKGLGPSHGNNSFIRGKTTGHGASEPNSATVFVGGSYQLTPGAGLGGEGGLYLNITPEYELDSGAYAALKANFGYDWSGAFEFGVIAGQSSDFLSPAYTDTLSLFGLGIGGVFNMDGQAVGIVFSIGTTPFGVTRSYSNTGNVGEMWKDEIMAKPTTYRPAPERNPNP